MSDTAKPAMELAHRRARRLLRLLDLNAPGVVLACDALLLLDAVEALVGGETLDTARAALTKGNAIRGLISCPASLLDGLESA